MSKTSKLLTVRTGSRTELVDVTAEVAGAVRDLGVRDGTVLLFVPHTTAAVTINENADPDVPADILRELNKVIPFEDGYAHGEGNSAAHIKSSLVGPSLLVPVEGGRPALGTWQGIFFCEFDGPRSRKLRVSRVPP
jgi:secondary thiamine-phosphate synthase enzyme